MTKVMTVRNLQFGDWIADINGSPMQITSVGKVFAYANFADNEELYLRVFDDKIEPPYPIKITKEILEKNGCNFYERELDYDFATRWFPEEKIYFEWRDNNKTLAIWFDYEHNNDGVYSDIIVPVKYVHEMQQVLRLAGLTDVANNFKV